MKSASAKLSRTILALLVVMNISKVDVPDHLGHGDGVGKRVQ